MISPFNLGHEYEYGTEFRRISRSGDIRSEALITRLFFVSPPTKVWEICASAFYLRSSEGLGAPFDRLSVHVTKLWELCTMV